MTHKLDLLITNGRILDGTGNPAYEADIGITGGEIAVVTRDPGNTHAEGIIDAEGMVVSPGFIDTHSHDDAYLLINPQCEDKVRQGVTTDVIGNCGFSLAPLSDEHRDDLRKASAIMGAGHLPDDFWNLSSFEEFLALLDNTRPGINVVPLVGHGTSLPARTFGLYKKGILREKHDADVVIFDPETVIDQSTFDDPSQPPAGIHWVIVNGELAVENGEVVGATSGQVLRRG